MANDEHGLVSRRGTTCARAKGDQTGYRAIGQQRCRAESARKSEGVSTKADKEAPLTLAYRP